MAGPVFFLRGKVQRSRGREDHLDLPWLASRPFSGLKSIIFKPSSMIQSNFDIPPRCFWHYIEAGRKLRLNNGTGAEHFTKLYIVHRSRPMAHVLKMLKNVTACKFFCQTIHVQCA